MTKKAATLLLAVSLAVSVCAMPVFAEGTPPASHGGTVQETAGEKIDSTKTGIANEACTKLTYKVTEGYTWSIPADINFGEDKGVDKKVNPEGTPKTTVVVSSCKIKNGKTLHIDMKGNGGGDEKIASGATGEFKIMSAEKEKLTYEVKMGETLTDITTVVNSGDDVLTLDAGNETLTKYLSFTLKTAEKGTNGSEKAGSYHGYAIFTAQLKDTVTTPGVGG